MEDAEKVLEATQLRNLIIHLVLQEDDLDTLHAFLTILTTEKRLREVS